MDEPGVEPRFDGKHCTTCSDGLSSKEKTLFWEAMEFCDVKCLGQFELQNSLHDLLTSLGLLSLLFMFCHLQKKRRKTLVQSASSAGRTSIGSSWVNTASVSALLYVSFVQTSASSRSNVLSVSVRTANSTSLKSRVRLLPTSAKSSC